MESKIWNSFEWSLRFHQHLRQKNVFLRYTIVCVFKLALFTNIFRLCRLRQIQAHRAKIFTFTRKKLVCVTSAILRPFHSMNFGDGLAFTPHNNGLPGYSFLPRLVCSWYSACLDRDTKKIILRWSCCFRSSANSIFNVVHIHRRIIFPWKKQMSHPK